MCALVCCYLVTNFAVRRCGRLVAQPCSGARLSRYRTGINMLSTHIAQYTHCAIRACLSPPDLDCGAALLLPKNCLRRRPRSQPQPSTALTHSLESDFDVPPRPTLGKLCVEAHLCASSRASPITDLD
eukprot:1425846-Pleurochrysis_carterae.AAC.2